MLAIDGNPERRSGRRSEEECRERRGDWQRARAGSGVPCQEAQADGFPCPELMPDCSECAEEMAEREGRSGRLAPWLAQ